MLNQRTFNFKDQGIYKITIQDTQDTRFKERKGGRQLLLSGRLVSSKESDGLNRDISPQALGEHPVIGYGSSTMLAGIDPEAEAKLVGLDKATKKATHSRFFTKDDVVNDYGNDVWSIH